VAQADIPDQRHEFIAGADAMRPRLVLGLQHIASPDRRDDPTMRRRRSRRA